MTLRTLAAAACMIASTATAGLAATFTVGGSDFEITTITGSFDDNASLLMDNIFFGDEDLAVLFAETVADGLGLTSFGNDPDDQIENGPLFAFGLGTNQNGSSFLEIVGIRRFTDFGVIGDFNVFDADFGTSQVGEFAVATPVSAVPLPAGGLLLISAFGGVAALKRRKKRAA